MKHIGIFGGSFNPVHIGHMIVADYMVQFGGFDEVWLMLSPQNPLKDSGDLRPQDERLVMLRMAVGHSPRLKASDFEFSLPRPSYTYVTLDALAEAYGPDYRFSLIVGSDNWAIFHRWRNGDYILQKYGVAVYPRLGYPIGMEAPGMRRVDAPVVEISSTMIREAIASGHDMTYFLPAGVMNYIDQHKLYRQ